MPDDKDNTQQEELTPQDELGDTLLQQCEALKNMLKDVSQAEQQNTLECLTDTNAEDLDHLREQ